MENDLTGHLQPNDSEDQKVENSLKIISNRGLGQMACGSYWTKRGQMADRLAQLNQSANPSWLNSAGQLAPGSAIIFIIHVDYIR
ncbi:hypothetical protein DVH24_011024 [Malus domestica]|uniref:Uncharacterized protein n=1 Tax=Malus domestica TaxID=3750 RepID=A0A498JRX9_MALDO|nr:hypothetical protein DVH24_011024 [Malus domestica]